MRIQELETGQHKMQRKRNRKIRADKNHQKFHSQGLKESYLRQQGKQFIHNMADSKLKHEIQQQETSNLCKVQATTYTISCLQYLIFSFFLEHNSDMYLYFQSPHFTV